MKANHIAKEKEYHTENSRNNFRKHLQSYQNGFQKTWFL